MARLMTIDNAPFPSINKKQCRLTHHPKGPLRGQESPRNV
jgi:hypothetical protein